MHQIVWNILFLIAISTCFYAIYPDDVKKVEQCIELVENVGQNLDSSLKCDLNNDRSIESCLSFICGDEKNRKSFYKDKKIVEDNIVEIINKRKVEVVNIIKLFDEHKKLKIEIENERIDRLKRIKKYILDGGNLKLDSEFENFHKILFSLMVFDLYDISFNFDDKFLLNGVKVIYANNRDKKIQLTKNDNEYAVNVSNELYNSKLGIDFLNMMMMQNIEQYVKSQDPGKELKDIIKEKYNDYKKSIEKIKKINPVFGEIYRDTLKEKTIDQIQKGEMLSRTELANAMGSLELIKIIENIYEHPDQYPLFYGRNLELFASDDDKKAILDHIDKKIRDREQVYSDDSSESARSYCIAKYLVNSEMSPQSNQNVLAIYNKAKNDIFAKVFPFFSKESYHKIKQHINNIETTLPQTKGEYSNSFVNEIKYEIKDYENEIEMNKKILQKNKDEQFQYDLVHELRGLYVYHSDEKKKNRFHSIMDICDKMAPQYTDSASLSLSGNINISILSATNPQLGGPILKHELGHQISRFFSIGPISEKSKNKFVETKKCLSKLHKVDANTSQVKSILKYRDEKSGNVADFEFESGFYSEEDWADYIMNLSADRLDGNIGCYFLTSIKEAKVEQSNPEDVHSSDAFRAISNYAYLHGQIPTSCNFALKKTGGAELLMCRDLP